MAKEKYQIEFPLKTSDRVLFNRLSSAGGLNEWFADNVIVQGKIYTFVWNGIEQQAEMITKKEFKSVRFHWIEDDDDKTFFEFRIVVDELTGELALIVTDFADPEEIDDAKELWDTQIANLRHILGS